MVSWRVACRGPGEVVVSILFTIFYSFMISIITRGEETYAWRVKEFLYDRMTIAQSLMNTVLVKEIYCQSVPCLHDTDLNLCTLHIMHP